MTRNEAIQTAVSIANQYPENYVGPNFMPHEWVIRAIQAAHFMGQEKVRQEWVKANSVGYKEPDYVGHVSYEEGTGPFG